MGGGGIPPKSIKPEVNFIPEKKKRKKNLHGAQKKKKAYKLTETIARDGLV